MKKLTTAQKQREILANNLNDLLNKKRKTQADVIRETGLAEATVRSWFSGEKYPRLEGLQTLADYFNVPRSRLTEEQLIAIYGIQLNVEEAAKDLPNDFDLIKFVNPESNGNNRVLALSSRIENIIPLVQ